MTIRKTLALVGNGRVDLDWYFFKGLYCPACGSSDVHNYSGGCSMICHNCDNMFKLNLHCPWGSLSC